MKNICISTFCYWSNYGSIFQAIGLKRTLDSLGFSSFIVQDEPKDKAVPAKNFPPIKALLSKQGIRHLHTYLIRNKTEKLYLSSQKFIDDNLNLIYFNNYDELKKYPPAADFYLAGSDQIWNLKRCLPTCFLQFAPCNSPKFSYAASMGVADLPNEKYDIFTQYIESFDSLSVREKDNAELIKTFTGRNSEIHIDPSLLLSVDEWREYEEEREVNGPYILVYALYWNRKYNKELKKLKKDTGCRVIVVSSTLRPIFSDETLYDVTPGEFLWLLDHASYVVTSSFHGVALSILFNKQFATVINSTAPSRIVNILEVLSVKKRGIIELTKRPIDFTQTNKIIEQERIRGKEYLSTILNA